MLALSFIPASILSYAIYNSAKDELTENLEGSTIQVTQELNNNITSYFNGYELVLNSLSKNIIFSNFIKNDKSDKSEIENYLNNILENNESVSSIYFTTNDNTLLMYSKKEVGDLTGFDATSRDWFKDAINNEKMIVGNPYIDEIDNKQVITISKSVMDKNKVIGVIGMDIDITYFNNEISKSRVGDNGYLYLTQLDGTIITHPNHELISTELNQELKNIVKNDKEKFVSYNEDSKEVFITHTKNELTNWTVISSVEKSELKEDLNNVLTSIIIILSIILIFSILFVAKFSKEISRNMEILNNSLKSISKGDLTKKPKIDSNDEFKDLEVSVNLIIDNMSSVLEGVATSSKDMLNTAKSLNEMTYEVSESSNQATISIEEIAKGNSDQSNNIQDVLAQIIDLSNEMKHMTSNNEKVEENSIESMNLSNKGIEKVDFMNEKFLDTKTAAIQMNETMKEVSTSISKITEMVNVINSISEQTNLLALNAAIEAARVGESGKGFSVVAQEIRKLAEKSKESNNNIKSIVDLITNSTTLAMNSMHQTMNNIDEQDIAVQESKEIFEQILNSVKELTEKVNDTKQSIEIVENNKDTLLINIENISAISEQTAASSQEVSASSEEISASMEEFKDFAKSLTDLSENMDDKINHFKLK